MIDELPERSAAMVQLVEELTVMWKDPAQRLEQISTTDAALMEEMQMTAADGEDDNASVADAASEYSAATQQSMMSTRSDRSDSSRQSGTSTVSILSQLSTASSSRGGGGGAGKEQSGAFSIEGIEHSLLSRGNVDHYESSAVKGSGYSKGKRNRGKHACAGAGAGASGGATEEGEGDGSVINTNVSTSEGQKSKKVYKRDSTPRRQRRIERSKTKAGSRDVWGLRRENAVCEELLGYALVDSITRSASEMSDVLSLLSSSPRHQALVMQLQQAVEAHLQVLQSNPPPVAPHYPLEWLKKRAMGSVRYYQDIEAMILATPMKLHLAASGGDADEGAAGTAASATATATAAVTMASLLRIDASAVRTAKAAAQLYQQHAAAAVPTWWALAARGLREWYAHGSRLTLQLPVEHKAASVLGDPAASLEHK